MTSKSRCSKLKEKYGAKQDTDLTADQLKELCEIYKKVYQQKVKKPFPQDPMEQLRLSVNAVFGSWNGERAQKYRQINKITGPARHGREHLLDGVRQHGRRPPARAWRSRATARPARRSRWAST